MFKIKKKLIKIRSTRLNDDIFLPCLEKNEITCINLILLDYRMQEEMKLFIKFAHIGRERTKNLANEIIKYFLLDKNCL